jgi:putative SOS response-associated peptidase YedK
MCGRYTIKTLPQAMIDAFGPLFGSAPDLSPRYNVAPSQPVPVVRMCDQGRQLQMMRWGLTPSWAADPAAGPKPINARSETVATSPAFRLPFQRRRCLLPADGFYEWKILDSKTKQPYYIHRKDNAPFAFAGIWDRWDKAEPPIESCAILTTHPNHLMESIHNRMPVILQPENYSTWLNPKTPQIELLPLLTPCPDTELEAYPITKKVNNPRFDGPDCLQPV